MSRRAATLAVSVLLAVIVAVIGALLPVPYVEFSPGPTYNTIGQHNGQPLIQIRGHQVYPASGHLNLVTITLTGGPGHELGLLNALGGWLDGHDAVVPEGELYQPSTTQQDAEHEATLQMQQSQNAAVSAALTELGIAPKAVKIAGFVDHVPAERKLRAGDVVVSVDGTAVAGMAQLQRLISGHQPGDRVTLGVVRNGHHLTVTVPTVKASGQRRAIVGIYIEPVWPFSVKFNLADVGGPSAGMMFALGIIDKLSPGDLTNGRFIAGTGEIGADGNVGAIGGIAQKMVAAHRDGANWFLAPAGNCADVRKADVPEGLHVVKVSTLDGALIAVKAIAQGHAAGLPSC